jgi:hypothetical protein
MHLFAQNCPKILHYGWKTAKTVHKTAKIKFYRKKSQTSPAMDQISSFYGEKKINREHVVLARL